MTTIKIKTSNTVETEREIQIPSYYATDYIAWKILSEKKTLKVYFGGAGLEIGEGHVSSIFHEPLNAQPSTAEFFESKFLEVMAKFANLAEHGIVLETENN